jgi:transcription elongation factor Elf1
VELGKLQYFEKIEQKKHREFVTAQSNCVLCGSVLELRHMQVSDKSQIKEEAHCTACNLRTRAKIYTLN